MKRKTTTCLLAMLAGSAAVSAESPDWTHTQLATEFMQMVPRDGGGVIVMGETRTEESLSDSDIYVSAIDGDGAVQWSHQWKGELLGTEPYNGADRFIDAAVGADGGLAILASYLDQDLSGDISNRLTVTQVDPSGNVISTTDLDWNAGSNAAVESIQMAMSDDATLLVSRSDSNFSTAAVMSIGSDGLLDWQLDLHDVLADASFIRITDLVAGPDGRAMLSGEIMRASEDRGMLAASINASGELEWSRIFSTPVVYGLQEGGAAIDQLGNLHVCGDLVNLNFDHTLHVAKINPQGDVLWEYNLDVEDASFFPSEMAVAENGNVYVGAHFYEPNGEGSFHGGFHAVALDSEGQSLWNNATSTIATAWSIQSTGLAVSPDGRVHVYGSGWIANQNSAHLMTTWYSDGSIESIEIWNNNPGHEKITDACYDENNEFYFCGRGEYINFRHSGIVCHFPDTFCLGDLDQNGAVDVTDLLSMLAAFGTDTMPAADLNDDGSVDVSDLLMLLEYWGGCEA